MSLLLPNYSRVIDFGIWREWLHEEPSHNGFRRLCLVALSAEPDPFEQFWLPYALEHLKHWPIQTRAASLRCPLGPILLTLEEAHPACQMIAHLVVAYSNETPHGLEFVENPYLHNLESLEIVSDDRCLGASELKRLAQWPGLANIRRLALCGHRLNDADMALVLQADLRSLESLDVSDNALTGTCLEALSNTPLTALCMKDNPVALRRLETWLKSPSAQHLHALDVEAMPATSLSHLQPVRQAPWTALGAIEVEKGDSEALVNSGALRGLADARLWIESPADVATMLDTNVMPVLRRLHVISSEQALPELQKAKFGRLSRIEIEIQGDARTDAVPKLVASGLRHHALRRLNTLRLQQDTSLADGDCALQWSSMDEHPLRRSTSRMLHVRATKPIDIGLFASFQSVKRVEWLASSLGLRTVRQLSQAPWWSGVEGLSLTCENPHHVGNGVAWEVLQRHLEVSAVRSLKCWGFHWSAEALKSASVLLRRLNALDINAGPKWGPLQMDALIAGVAGSSLRRLRLGGVSSSMADDAILGLTPTLLPELSVLVLTERFWEPSVVEALCQSFGKQLQELHVSYTYYREHLAWMDAVEGRYPLVWIGR